MKKILFAALTILFAQVATADSFVMENLRSDINITPVVENTSCAGWKSGDIGMSSEGLILSCQSGTWRSSIKLGLGPVENFTGIGYGAGRGDHGVCPAGYIMQSFKIGHFSGTISCRKVLAD